MNGIETICGIEFDSLSRVVTKNGKRMRLGPMMFALLQAIAVASNGGNGLPIEAAEKVRRSKTKYSINVTVFNLRRQLAVANFPVTIDRIKINREGFLKIRS